MGATFNLSKNEPTAFVHVGYPKTGSTYLQERLFRSHPHINNAMLNPDFASLVYALSFAEYSKAALREAKKKGFGEFLSSTQVNVISSEGMTDPDKLVPRGGTRNHLNRIIVDFSALLRHYGYRPHFLIMPRKQPEALISRYAEKYSSFIPIDPNFEDPSIFYDTLMNHSENTEELLRLYDYRALVDLLKAKKIDFSILPYEKFSDDHTQFISELSSILNVDERYAQEICSGRYGKRVSPKLSTYEYFAYYQSAVEDKLDVPHSIALDKKAKFCETEEFLKNDTPENRHINYRLLSEITNDPIPLRSVASFMKEGVRIVSLSADQVKAIKNYYRAGNEALDREFNLGLAEANYY